MVPIQHLTAELTDGGEAGKVKHRKCWTKAAKWMHDRRQGAQKTGDFNQTLNKKKIKRRTKTLKSLLSLDIVIRQITKKGLEQCQLRFGDDDVDLTNPFEWKRLNTATGMGPDKVTGDHFLAYMKI